MKIPAIVLRRQSKNTVLAAAPAFVKLHSDIKKREEKERERAKKKETNISSFPNTQTAAASCVDATGRGKQDYYYALAKKRLQSFGNKNTQGKQVFLPSSSHP